MLYRFKSRNAGDVIMLDKRKMIELADELGVSIVGVPPAHSAGLL